MAAPERESQRGKPFSMTLRRPLTFQLAIRTAGRVSRRARRRQGRRHCMGGGGCAGSTHCLPPQRAFWQAFDPSEMPPHGSTPTPRHSHWRPGEQARASQDSPTPAQPAAPRRKRAAARAERRERAEGRVVWSFGEAAGIGGSIRGHPAAVSAPHILPPMAIPPPPGPIHGTTAVVLFAALSGCAKYQMSDPPSTTAPAPLTSPPRFIIVTALPA